ncbi:hypothetical protein [Dialister succinatiphilus]|uniref:hypothetical protein n=1 Tax=Dialister succinatiphilus TaxID=487173 RepID=UPI003FEF2026
MLIKLLLVYYNRFQQMFPRKIECINKNNRRIIKRERDLLSAAEAFKDGPGLARVSFGRSVGRLLKTGPYTFPF